MLLAGRHDFVIEQGQTWRKQMTWRDSEGNAKDLSTGWTAKFTIRHFPGDKGAAIAERTSEEGIALGATPPNIEIIISPVKTAFYSFTRGYYTLELEETGQDTYRLLEGNVYLIRETTN